MTKKRFGYGAGVNWQEDIIIDYETEKSYDFYEVGGLLNELYEENKKLKLQNEELLYQIGRVGKNNKTCQECECFIPEFKYCYMWDMEIEADEVVVACDQRKVKNAKEMISDD